MIIYDGNSAYHFGTHTSTSIFMMKHTKMRTLQIILSMFLVICLYYFCGDLINIVPKAAPSVPKTQHI